MAGKRYTKEEIEAIVSKHKSGVSFEDLSKEFNRPVKALKIVYDRNQAGTEAEKTEVMDNSTVTDNVETSKNE